MRHTRQLENPTFKFQILSCQYVSISVNMHKSFFEAHRHKAIELETHLSKHQYFSKGYLPGLADSLMFQIFDHEFPHKSHFPSIYYWYINVKQFSRDAIKSWAARSDHDEYFVEILKNYKKWKEEPFKSLPFGQRTLEIEDAISSRAFTKSEYIINISFKADQKNSVDKLLRRMQKKTQTNIKTCNFINDSAKIEIKCNGNQIENLKYELDGCNSVMNYELKKKKNANRFKVRTSAFIQI